MSQKRCRMAQSSSDLLDSPSSGEILATKTIPPSLFFIGSPERESKFDIDLHNCYYCKKMIHDDSFMYADHAFCTAMCRIHKVKLDGFGEQLAKDSRKRLSRPTQANS
ncbi:hypothetical protein M5689_015994 [Euphorbia peplus]|nr:hypothetical protein M5689_015994 [Euphorbia peplus]